MATARSVLDILINAKNNASAALKEIFGDLNNVEKGASSLHGAIVKVGAALGVAFTAQAAWDLAQLAAQAERTATAFDMMARQANQSSQDMLKAMQTASRGTISDTELMLSANRAMMLGVADTAQEMAALIEVAAARAKVMGMTTADAFNDLVTGLGRMSPLILDNLGIVTGGEAVFDNYAASIGTTADKLSDAEKKQALLKIILEQSLPLIQDTALAADDNATKFERWAASIANAKVQLGGLLAGPLAGAAQGLADLAQMATEIGDMNWQNLTTKELLSNLNTMGDRWWELREGVTQTKDAFSDSELKIRNAGGSMSDTSAAAQVLAQMETEAGAAAAAHADDLDTVGASARKVTSAYDTLVSKVSGVLSGALSAGLGGVDPADFLPREDAINENARRLADIMANGFKGQDWMGEFAAEVPDIFKILQESSNPSEIAALMLDEFQQGLWPELIDREKAKQMVRRMIIGEGNMAELAQEIAAELSQEMGVSMQQALGAAQGALGVGGGTDAGMAAGSQFGQGVQDSATETGERTIKSLVASIEAKFTDLYAAGKQAGAQWGNGFMATVGENIPPGLIDILVMKVLPAVMGAQMAQTAAQGAK